MTKWTILFVNHYSYYYFENQLKILYENNPTQIFNLIIVDNSPESEINLLRALIKKYNEKFNNIELMHYNPVGEFNEEKERDEHGETVNFAMKFVKTKYLLIQDPDFFWTKRDYLAILENCLKKGAVAIGAPYPGKAAYGAPDFPCSFGCAYNVESIRDVDFMGEYLDQKLVHKARQEYPESKGYSGYPLDMGYKIRIKLSKFMYISFKQKTKFLSRYFGTHGITNSVVYFLDDTEIGWHLFGGSRKPNQVYGYRDKSSEEQYKILKRWRKVRKLYSKYFYIRSRSVFLSNILLYLLYCIKLKDSLFKTSK